jgi:hypothetical protein
MYDPLVVKEEKGTCVNWEQMATRRYFVSNLDLQNAEQLMEIRTEAARLEAESHGLLRRAGVARRGWLSRQACRLLAHLGRSLVALGKRLEQYSLPQSLPLEGQMGGHR